MSIGIKNPFFKVSVTIELGHSLLSVSYHELFDNTAAAKVGNEVSSWFYVGLRLINIHMDYLNWLSP